MAVVVEAYTVIIRREAVRRAFAGDESAFEARLPNLSGAKDQHLYRVGFFDYFDAEAFITRVLTPSGLAWLQGEEAVDLSLVEQHRGLHHYTPWLEVGQLPVTGGNVTAAWFAGAPPGELALHQQFNYEKYSGLQRQTIEETTKWPSVPTDDPRLQTLLDPETGKQVHILRNTTATALPAGPEITPEFQRLARLQLEGVWRIAHQVLGAKHGAFAIDAPRLERARAQLEDLLLQVEHFARGSLSYDAAAHFTQGYVLMALDRDVEAEPALRRAFALAPNAGNILAELMANLSTLGRNAEAIELGRRMVDQGTLHPKVVINLAVLLHREGESGDALALLERLIGENPQHEEAREVRRRIEAASKSKGGLIGRLLRRGG